ncbi:hypothetical protein [Mesorhizobium xinjiangense]|uniref:hypothetical protein n=1 Tax=Mesorhizobium xinjiangense TaxID=2678685 RepID=UPI0012ED5ED3|nr:hypothetical protein [Mesorhizobium xinjiangense]
MFDILKQITQRAHPAFATMAVLALAGLAFFSTDTQAQAGYGCVTNTTQIGNSVVLDVLATFGGPFGFCVAGTQAGSSSTSVSASVLSTKIGSTTGTVTARSRAVRQGSGSDFEVTCTTPTGGGACNSSNSGSIDGVASVQCRVDGGTSKPLPNPALPLVPVAINTTCTINY